MSSALIIVALAHSQPTLMKLPLRIVVYRPPSAPLRPPIIETTFPYFSLPIKNIFNKIVIILVKEELKSISEFGTLSK